MLWSGFKAVGRETLRTDGRILSDLADNKAVDVRPRHIIAEHVSDSARTLIQKLRGKGRKRSAALKLRPTTEEGENQGGEDCKKEHLCLGLIIP